VEATAWIAEINLMTAVKLLVEIFVTAATAPSIIICAFRIAVDVHSAVRLPFKLIAVVIVDVVVLSAARLPSNLMAVVMTEVSVTTLCNEPNSGTYINKFEFCTLATELTDEAHAMTVVKFGVADARLNIEPSRLIAVLIEALGELATAAKLPSSFKPTKSGAGATVVIAVMLEAKAMIVVRSEVALLATDRAAASISMSVVILTTALGSTTIDPFNRMSVVIELVSAEQIATKLPFIGTKNVGSASDTLAIFVNAPNNCTAVFNEELTTELTTVLVLAH
jgi:hypothetical protein